MAAGLDSDDRHAQARQAAHTSIIRSQGLHLAWLHLRVPSRLLTERVETGALPRAREWVTEVVVGLSLLVLVRKVRSDHRALETIASRSADRPLEPQSLRRPIGEECARAPGPATRGSRSGQPLRLVYIDVDDFKRFNDRAGHAEGDRVLQHLCGSMGTVVRDRL